MILAWASPFKNPATSFFQLLFPGLWLYTTFSPTWLSLIIPFNRFKPDFTIVISIHYKPRIAVAILDL